ncbi:LytTR family DNA-binding domain-containing protein [Paraburkholderia sp. BL10I2N1]|uniref:LytR/AlgR family response regulator transcription factor n=1 Tax=Paraburkholderia sp. BL10I2N1 TaxID=1938796 RepID=UPI00105CA4C2|nr:LytTR family DNA-binding domain-containing protein [Paraburkholderia sp. BL10I2N1]TDN57850.1 LytTR family two component transcriptional regulator [Paraburkholderia sp. BL10I2N1]
MKIRQPRTAAQHNDGKFRSPEVSRAPTALIAEDEPPIAAALQRELAAAWPELQIVATVGNGHAAIEQIGALQPDVAFLDISMPGATGLDVARACANLAAPPQIVFVTAYDEYALDAFDAAAIDYLLKPVDAARLARTVDRLRVQLARAPTDGAPGAQVQADLQRLLGQLEQITRGVQLGNRTQDTGRNAPLRYLRASSGRDIRIVPVEEVLYFEAADKYVVITTRTGELLIRTSLKELCVQLDPARFWQVHRSTVVNVDQVESASVSALGTMSLKLRGHSGAVTVSKQYAHLFRQM